MKYLKQILLAIFLLAIAALLFFFFMNNKKEEQVVNKNIEPQLEQKKAGNVKNNVSNNAKVVQKENSAPAEKEEKTLKKANLYGNYPAEMINFSTIAQLANSSSKAQKTISGLVESSQAIFYSAENSKKLYLVKDVSLEDSEKYPRHGIEFAEISLLDGHIERFYTGYYDDRESEQDVWKYDKKTGAPISHIHKDSDGNVVFKEIWNENDELKYKMVDSKNNVISMFKESIDDGTNLRQEHIFYDTEGKIRMNISANYEGSDLVRFTYFDAQNPELSGSVVSEYKDGLKQKETIYTSDYKVKNVYQANYSDGERTELNIFDSNNQEIDKILAE